MAPRMRSDFRIGDAAGLISSVYLCKWVLF